MRINCNENKHRRGYIERVGTFPSQRPTHSMVHEAARVTGRFVRGRPSTVQGGKGGGLNRKDMHQKRCW